MQPCLFLVCDTVCLLSLYTWKGEPAVLLEKGSILTNGHPCFQFWKHRVWSRRNPRSLLGGNPQQGFTTPEGIASLTTWSQISKVKDTCVCKGGWWTALSPVLLVSQQGGAPGQGWQEPGRGVTFTRLWWKLLGASIFPRKQ